MDISELTKVANRKRLNADAEKLREKVSRETAKVIKLKVAQDTAYWDLKEKLQQVEGNHERLQQNMVEVQMQHESISGQYQDELRLRPDTLNKLSSTREICDVLEEYSERLKDTLARCKSDQASLCEAYQKSGKLVHELKLQHERSDERNRQLIDSLQEKVKSSNEHQNQLLQYLSAAKQQADAELEETRVKLAKEQAKKEDLAAAVSELSHRLEQSKNEIQMKDSKIANIQKETKQLIHEFTVQSNDMNNAFAKKDKELKEAEESIEALRRAVNNQEQFAAGLREQNSHLHEQLSTAEDQLQAAQLEQNRLLENNKKENEDLKKTIAIMTEHKENLERMIQERDELVKTTEREMKSLKSRISDAEAQVTTLSSELREAKTQGDERLTQISNLQAYCQKLQANIEEIKSAFKAKTEKNEAKIEELRATITAKENELDSKAGTIAQLMCEVGSSAEVAANLEASLDKSQAKLEKLRDTIAEKERELDNKAGTIAQLMSELGTAAEVAASLEASLKENEAKIEELTAIISEKQKELDSKASNIERLLSEIGSAAIVAAKLDTTLKQNQTKVEGLTATIAEKEKDLNSKAGTIAELMREVSTAAGAAAKLEASLEKMRKESEREREIARDREGKQAQQIEQLQKKVAEKEKEFSKQMTVILAMRNEKEHLQENIKALQNRIDNVQKELTGQPQLRPAGDAPEQDDNAVAFALTPRPKPPRDVARPQNVMKSPIPRKQAVNNRSESPSMDMVFNFFSDNSMDDDPNMMAQQQREVDRRFEALARGENQPAVPLSAYRRRKAPSGGLVTKDEDDHMSVSQIKKNMKNNEPPRKFFKSGRPRRQF